jgi:hypothetical protein
MIKGNAIKFQPRISNIVELVVGGMFGPPGVGSVNDMILSLPSGYLPMEMPDGRSHGTELPLTKHVLE